LNTEKDETSAGRRNFTRLLANAPLGAGEKKRKNDREVMNAVTDGFRDSIKGSNDREKKRKRWRKKNPQGWFNSTKK